MVKSTISVSVTDGTNGISGAKVTLTDSSDSSKTYTSTSSGTAGGCSISNVSAGTYIVTVSTVPTGYTVGTYSNLVVSSETTNLSVILTKNS